MSKKAIIKRLQDFIKANQLINKGKIGIAVSGGPDSIFLAHSLNILKNDLGIKIYILHFNHMLRKEAKEEEQFVKEFSNSIDANFLSDSFDVGKFAKNNKLSTEEAARIKRYEFLHSCKTRLNLNSIAIAHTKNDIAETFLINMLRGSSIKGLSSLRIKRGFYIRPLIFLEKKEIIDYLKENRIEYKTDSSNFYKGFLRNRIRLELMEQLKDINPNIVDTLYRESEILSKEDRLLDNIAEKEFTKRLVLFNKERLILNIDRLSNDNAILYRLISMAAKKLLNTQYSLSFKNIERIALIKNTQTVVLRKKLKAYTNKDRLVFEKL